MDKDILNKLNELTEEELRILEGENYINKSIYTDDMNFIIDSNKLLSNDELISIRKHTRFVNFPSHKHNYIEFNYVYEGKFIQIIDGKETSLKKGELIFLNQNINHEIKASNKEDIIINFIIKPEFFEYLTSLIDNENIISKFLLSTLYGYSDKGEYLYFKVSKRRYIQDLLERIIIEIYSPSVMNKTTIKLLLGLLLVELIKNSNDIEVYSIDNYEKMVMLHILKYIEKFYRDGSLSELSKELKLPDYKLSKLIKKHTKLTFKELIQEKRISKSIELIKTTEYSIMDIINIVGYENPTYFYKIFKEKYKMTPKEYKSSLINNHNI